MGCHNEVVEVELEVNHTICKLYRLADSVFEVKNDQFSWGLGNDLTVSVDNFLSNSGDEGYNSVSSNDCSWLISQCADRRSGANWSSVENAQPFVGEIEAIDCANEDEAGVWEEADA